MTSNDANFDIDKLAQIAEKKEEELRDVKKLQLSVLQRDLEEKDKLLNLERKRFECLKRDFEYNLKIIDQRDGELVQYEKAFTDLREVDNVRNSEASDMKITIEELNSKLEQCYKEKNELEDYYRKRIGDLQSQMNHFVAEKNRDNQLVKDEYMNFKRNAERRIQETEDEMETQKRILMFEFDEKIRKTENDFKSKIDKMENSIHAKDIHLKMTNKELQLYREGSYKVCEEKSELGDQISMLRKELSKKDWEMKDIENMAEIKVTEMTQKLDAAKQEKEDLNSEFSRIYSELDKAVNAKEQQIKALQQAADEKENLLRNEVEHLKNEVANAANKLKQSLWDFNDRLKQRDLKVQGLEHAISEKENKSKLELASFTQAVTSRDLEIEALKSLSDSSVSHINKLNTDLKELKQEYEKLKEREVLVTESKEDLELYWQKKYEEANQHAENKVQNLLAGLEKKVDASQSKLKEKENELVQRDHLIQVLTRDRDVAYSSLKRRGIEMKQMQFTELIPKDDFDSFVKQNEQLKNMISIMRKEIETIEDKHKKEINQASVEYAKDLEDRIKMLKAEKRGLENLAHDVQEQLMEAKRQKKVTFLDSSMDKDVSNPDKRLHSKLKSAAEQIQGLVLERDRLQNLGNKLRSEVVGLKEQLNAKKTMERIGDLGKEKKGRDGNDFNCLEDLHYRLAMDELRDRPVSMQKDVQVELASSSESSLLNVEGESGNIGADFVDQIPVQDLEVDQLVATDIKSGKSSTPTNQIGTDRQNVRSKSPVIVYSSSELSSLQDLWKILDEAESLASQTPRSGRPFGKMPKPIPSTDQETRMGQQSRASVAEIEGQHMVLQRKEQAREPKLSKLAQGKFIPAKKPQRIRNYNEKQD